MLNRNPTDFRFFFSEACCNKFVNCFIFSLLSLSPFLLYVCFVMSLFAPKKKSSQTKIKKYLFRSSYRKFFFSCSSYVTNFLSTNFIFQKIFVAGQIFIFFRNEEDDTHTAEKKLSSIILAWLRSEHESVSGEKRKKNEEAASKDMQNWIISLSPFVKVSFMLCWPAQQQRQWESYIYSNAAAITTTKKCWKKSLFFSSLYATFQLFNFDDGEEASLCRNIWLCVFPLSLSLSLTQSQRRRRSSLCKFLSLSLF